MIDIRKEIYALRSEFQWYGLRRVDYSRPCSCLNEDGISSPATCVRCMKTGYLFTDFLVKGYIWQGSLGVEFNSKATKLSTQTKNIIIEYDRSINKFDYILELAQSSETGKLAQPFRVLKSFQVQDSLSLKGIDGRVEFWRATLEERSFDDGRPGQIGTGRLYDGNADRSIL